MNETISGSSVDLRLNIQAFDGEAGEKVSISDVLTPSHRLLDNNSNLTVNQSYQLLGTPNCIANNNSNTSSETVLMFDRSGSISTNDPSERMLDAGVEFASLVDAPNQARIAQFTSDVSGVEYLINNFVSDSAALITAIQNIRAAGGNTPLWDSMFDVITSAG